MDYCCPTVRRIGSSPLLARHTEALGVSQPAGGPSEQTQRFDSDAHRDGAGLVISYMSPHFFTLHVLTPTAIQWGRETTGDEREFVVSEEGRFREVFDAGTIAGGGSTWPQAVTLRLVCPAFVAYGLQYIHSRDCFHCDLKPSNIVMGVGNRANMVYLIDFGLSKEFRDPNTRAYPIRQ